MPNPESRGPRPGRQRFWTVYLLNEHCGLSNRQAILLWNEKLGAEHDAVYTMTDMEAGLSTSRVSQLGESHFSKDKREIKFRICGYQSELAARLANDGLLTL